MTRRAETYVLPRAAAVGRFVNAIAISKVGAEIGFASANIDDLRIRWRHGNRTDRRDRLAVKDWPPSDAAVGGLPYAAAYAAKVINIWLAFNSGHSDGAPATMRTDHPPAQTAIKVGIKLL